MKNKFYIVITAIIFFSIFFVGISNAKAACKSEQDALNDCLPPTDCTPVINALKKCNCIAAGENIKVLNDGLGTIECVPKENINDDPVLPTYSSGDYGDNSNFTKIGGVSFPIVPGLADPQGGIAQILSNVLSWLLGIFTTIAIIAFVISGIMYLTSTGDTDQIEKAKNNAKFALLGVIVGLSGFIVLKAIQLALSGSKIF